MDYTAHYLSPIGGITLASDGKALVGLWFDGQNYFTARLDPVHEERQDLEIFAETRRWLDMYFSGKNPDFLPNIALRGSEFRKATWRKLLEIPYGQTATYGALARSMNCKSAQAVGGAVGHNPLSLIVPCHRVVGTGGKLTGYAGGIDKKEWLLHMEGARAHACK